MRKHIWLNYLLAYFVWAIVLVLGIWLLLLSRQAFLSAGTTLYVQDSLKRAWQLRSLEKFYVLAVGLVCLIIMIVSEFYFRNGVHRGHLFPRFARILGLEMLLLFVADAVLLLVQGPQTVAWMRWPILGVEFVLSIVFLALARSSPSIMSDFRASDPDPDANLFS